MITVLHVRKTKPWGGIETSLIGWFRYFDRAKISPRLFIFKEVDRIHIDSAEKFAAQGITVEFLPWYPFRNLPGAVRTLVRAVRQQSPTVIHTHDTHSDLVGLITARITNTPLIVTNHAWHTRDFWNAVRQFGPVRWLHEAIRGPIIKRADLVANGSRDTHEEGLRRGIAPGKSIVLYSGIDLAPFRDAPPKQAARRSLDLPEDAFVVGNLARMYPEKAQKTLVDAARALRDDVPNLRILIVGDGPLRNELTQYADTLGVADVVRFPGFRKDVVNVLAALDVFALPSTAEGTPLAVYEAMGMELPIIASEVSGTGEILKDGESAILIPPADAARLTEAIGRLALDASLRSTLATNAARAVSQGLSADVAAANYQRLYEQLIDARRSPATSSPPGR